MTPYEVGHRDGCEAARQGLLDNQRIAAKWAEHRLEVVTESVADESAYRAGYRAGYRETLTSYLAVAK